MAQQCADKGSEEVQLEAQWKGVCSALEEFLRGESTDAVFMMQRMHPMTVQRLRDTYQVEVSDWTCGSHMIKRTLLKPCENGKTNQCLLKCMCQNK